MKNFFLTDIQIQDLIAEPKILGCSASALMHGMKNKSEREASHSQSSRKIPRINGEGDWLIYLRRNRGNQFDFSCGLGFFPKGRNQAFTLTRYNGKSHQHTNRLEKENPFYDFHIHTATEKYQLSSYSTEHRADITDRYADFYGAFTALLDDCNVSLNGFDSGQTSLF